jgi:hypothetical protein
VEPGGNVSVRLLADIEADTPYDHLILRLHEAGMIGLADATDPSNIPGLREVPDCDGFLPFETASAGIYLPAGTPAFEVTPLATQIGTPGGMDIVIFAGELTYETSGPQGDLVLVNMEGTVLKRSASGDTPIGAAEVFTSVSLVSGDEVVATDSVLAGTAIDLVPAAEYVVSRGTGHSMMLVCDLSASVPAGNYAIEFQDATFIRLADRNLETPAYPDVAGAGFPLRSADISITSDNLADSFTNYPNPFNPGRGEETTIGYYIAETARVDIEIFTVTGELVRTIASNSERAEGAHQEDRWAGLNSGGLGVLPGTYLCRITATYASGRVETCRRKVMVIR